VSATRNKLCYQLPVMVLPRITVVVSPLVALMIDQLRQLPLMIRGGLLCSSQVLDVLSFFKKVIFFFFLKKKYYPVWIIGFHPGNRGTRFRSLLLKFNNQEPAPGVHSYSFPFYSPV